MLPMPLGAHTFGFVWQSTPEAAFETIAALGVRRVQLMAAPPHFDPWREDGQRSKRLRAIIERSGLDLLALDLASSDINLASPSADVVAFAVKAYENAIFRAVELGARAICVGSGRRHPLIAEANRDVLPSFERAFREIVASARRHGVSVLLENHPQGLLATADAIGQFLANDDLADVDVIYDVANGMAAGEDPLLGFERLQHRIAILHVSDTPRTQWRHDPIGTGAIDFVAIGQTLARHHFDRPVVLEILSPDARDGLALGIAALRAAGWNFDQEARKAGTST